MNDVKNGSGFRVRGFWFLVSGFGSWVRLEASRNFELETRNQKPETLSPELQTSNPEP